MLYELPSHTRLGGAMSAESSDMSVQLWGRSHHRTVAPCHCIQSPEEALSLPLLLPLCKTPALQLPLISATRFLPGTLSRPPSQQPHYAQLLEWVRLILLRVIRETRSCTFRSGCMRSAVICYVAPIASRRSHTQSDASTRHAAHTRTSRTRCICYNMW